MVAAPAILIETVARAHRTFLARTITDQQLTEFSGVFRGRELTRKDLRLSSGIAPLDAILDGGIVRGRVSEIVGRSGFGRTSLAAAFAAAVTQRGEVASWIDSSGTFDPRSIAAAGADLSRILWIGADAVLRARDAAESGSLQSVSARPLRSHAAIKAADLVLSAGGFGLVVVDFGFAIGGRARMLTLSAALRLARAAEQSGAAVIVLAERRTCGTFAALSLVLGHIRPFFSRRGPGAPALFDGMRVEAYVARNKLGGSGRAAAWCALVDSRFPAPASPASRRIAPPVAASVT